MSANVGCRRSLACSSAQGRCRKLAGTMTSWTTCSGFGTSIRTRSSSSAVRKSCSKAVATMSPAVLVRTTSLQVSVSTRWPSALRRAIADCRRVRICRRTALQASIDEEPASGPGLPIARAILVRIRDRNDLAFANLSPASARLIEMVRACAKPRHRSCTGFRHSAGVSIGQRHLSVGGQSSVRRNRTMATVMVSSISAPSASASADRFKVSVPLSMMARMMRR